MALNINEPITLTQGISDDEVKCSLIGISIRPEMLLNKSLVDVINLPVGEQGNYLHKQIAGFTEITLKAIITTINPSNKDSPILSDIEGIYNYDIDGSEDRYNIQKIDSGMDLNDNVSVITLIRNQRTFTNPNNSVTPNASFDFTITPFSSLEYSITEVVKGTNLIFSGLDTNNPLLKFEVYKYGDDDVFLNDLIYNPTFLAFQFIQIYKKDNVDETEVFYGEQDFQLRISNTRYVVNDLGVSAEVVTYEIYAPFGDQIIRELSN